MQRADYYLTEKELWLQYYRPLEPLIIQQPETLGLNQTDSSQSLPSTSNSEAATAVLCLPELVGEIFSWLPISGICQARQVNSHWKDIIDTSKSLLWTNIPDGMKVEVKRKRKTKLSDTPTDDKHLTRMCLPVIENLTVRAKVTAEDSKTERRKIKEWRVLDNDTLIDASLLDTVLLFVPHITKILLSCRMSLGHRASHHDLNYVLSEMDEPCFLGKCLHGCVRYTTKEDIYTVRDLTGIRVGAVVELCRNHIQREAGFFYPKRSHRPRDAQLEADAEGEAKFRIALRNLEIDEKKGLAKADLIIVRNLYDWPNRPMMEPDTEEYLEHLRIIRALHAHADAAT